ncbi:hypothetical protein, variant [Verruconis gallopava]|uniref:Protein arginine N-methyltransferase n=1 Tax=Verruconis gallopava TaxID=253628 RepID=A0A0D2AIU3_9PEZI|nr:hypothetical protein, variant [Verruconis gallopava]KIV98858.1 hypothetical protein, variant [Verruconis gallopava]
MPKYDLKSQISRITTPKFKAKILELYREHKEHGENSGAKQLEILPFHPEDIVFTPDAAGYLPLVATSSWLDICSEDDKFAKLSEKVLLQEISFASFCGVRNVLIWGPQSDIADSLHTRFIEVIQKALKIDPSVEISVVVSMNKHEQWRSWKRWDYLRSESVMIDEYLPNLSVQIRWASEPIRFVLFDKEVFKYDDERSLYLEEIQETFVADLLRRRNCPDIVVGLPLGNKSSTACHCKDILTSQGTESTEILSKVLEPFSEYFTRLRSCLEPFNIVEEYAMDYQYDDSLQETSRPATEILKNSTYSAFEEDPVKYDLYQKAIMAALRDWKLSGKSTSGLHGAVLVAVLGAGRGPLVTRALRASEAEGVSIDIWAVERNPNTICLLHQQNENEWQSRVSIVHSDVRLWNGPTVLQQGESRTKKATSIDIMVSEMLGDFGDNELAPECLDGALHLLAPWGLSIPSSFTTFITPVFSPALYSKVLARKQVGEPTAFEIPYWTWFRSVDYLSIGKGSGVAGSQNGYRSTLTSDNRRAIGRLQRPIPKVLPVWTFSHDPKSRPNNSSLNSHNSRYGEILFDIGNAGTCHGLAGYFECILYPGIELSTNPNTMDEKSPNMTSWLTMYFPLKEPLSLYERSKLKVSMARKTDSEKKS